MTSEAEAVPHGGWIRVTLRLRRSSRSHRESFATPVAINDATYGCQWSDSFVSRSERLLRLPEYFRLEHREHGDAVWVAVPAHDMPRETGLHRVTFPRVRTPSPEPYVTPDGTESCWKKPGPVAGPFKARSGDGSVVTDAWHRFAERRCAP